MFVVFICFLFQVEILLNDDEEELSVRKRLSKLSTTTLATNIVATRETLAGQATK